MTLSLRPTTAAAAETASENYSDSNVTWLGTEAEYQQTLDSMFPNGLRKIKAGDKWGIVDPTGEFVAPPIYDKIELDYRSLGKPDKGEPSSTFSLTAMLSVCRGGKL